jgi:hypothetical protein
MSITSALSRVIENQINNTVPEALGLFNQPINPLIELIKHKMSIFSKCLVAQLDTLKAGQKQERIIHSALQVLETLLNEYKILKLAIEREWSDSGQLDEDEKWHAKINSVNQLIVDRLKSSGRLHKALGSHENESTYLRSTVESVLLKQSAENSRVVPILLREFVVCRFLQPLINYLSKPQQINSFLIDKLNNLALLQKTVKSFRGDLENAFMRFPPSFLAMGGIITKFNSMTIDRKINLLEFTGRILKRIDSSLDILALKCSLKCEIRRVADKIAEQPMTDDARPNYELNRLLKSFEALLVKVDKRYSNIIEETVCKSNAANIPVPECSNAD